MSYGIRRAKPEDALEIIDSHVRSIREVCSSDYNAEQIQAWSGGDFSAEHWHKTILSDFVWVIEVGARVRGFGHMSILDANVAEVMGLYFAPEAKGLGGGKELMQIMSREAKARGIASLRLHSTLTAKPFYESFGFRQIEGNCEIKIGGVQIPCYPMVCSIG